MKRSRHIIAVGLAALACVASTSTPAAAQTPSSIWSTAVVPQGAASDTSAVELGVRFRSDTSGFISGLRFYKYATNTGTHVGNLWTDSGALLASATFTAESTSGWQLVTFATPIPITANTVYVASYHTNVGHYAVNTGYFAASGADAAPLHAPKDGVDGSNGVYRYGAASGFPSSTYNSTNYWVDVLFSTTAGTVSTPVTVNSITPARDAIGVAPTTVVTATFNSMMNAATVNSTTFELRDVAGNLVRASAHAGGETPTSTLTPDAPLVSGTRYTATVRGGPGGVKDEAGNAMVGDFSWSFTTSGTPPGPTTCPCTIWSAATPGPFGPDTDGSSVEVGVRFRSDTSGYITGLRFYKLATNTGPHTASLWTNSGLLLARANFSTETASGWQQMTLPAPVPIAANTSYVASYYTNSGHYASSESYFASAGFDNGPLHALRDGVDGPSGVYRYGSDNSVNAPNSTYHSTNYWVDVVYSDAPADDPPTIASVNPASGATFVTTATFVTATFSKFMDPATITDATVQLRTGGQVVPSTVTYSIVNGTAILRPASALLGGTTYTATVLGGSVDPRVKDTAGHALAETFTWSFTTTGTPPSLPATCPCTIWDAAAAPLSGPSSDVASVELGVRFRSDVGGLVTGVRFYKFASNTGPHTASLWTPTGAFLGFGTFTNESESGWQEMTFTSPVFITANLTYIASYHTDSGHYAASEGYFQSAVDNAPLHALQDGADGASGVYHYGTRSLPNQTYASTNYWVDVVFIPNPSEAPPTITSVSPANNAVAVSTLTTVTATFNKFMDPLTFTGVSTVPGASVHLRKPSGEEFPVTMLYDAVNRTIIVQPTRPLAEGTTYTATIDGGTVTPRVKDFAGNSLADTYSWSFTTAAATPTPTLCPCTIWYPGTTTPAGPEIDANAVELGLRFRSDADGYITGVRFYKHSTNTGTHVGSLWTNTGTLIASATFINETGSGWQQVTFPAPVAITANTTYVASYHTNVGHYPANSFYMTVGFDNVPLHALKDGVDGPSGVYRYGAASAFPDQTYFSTNYWVDVVFSPTVPAP
jgi:hypothetical protein